MLWKNKFDKCVVNRGRVGVKIEIQLRAQPELGSRFLQTKVQLRAYPEVVSKFLQCKFLQIQKVYLCKKKSVDFQDDL